MSAVVVRAGIAGASVAYHLARRGVPVTLLEQGPAPANGVTGDSFAWIGSSGRHWPGGAQDLREHVLADHRRLENELPHIAVRRTGSLSWAGTPAQDSRPGPGQFRIGRSDIAALEPNLRHPPDQATPPQRRRRRPNSPGPRPLGIPVIRDRAHQARVKNALEPEWEARFEARSYCVRPGRGCHDALAAIFQVVGKPISPLLLNIALHGMEGAAGVSWKGHGNPGAQGRVSGPCAVRGRLRGHLPHAEGRARCVPAAEGMVHAQGPGLQRGDDFGPPPHGWLRLPRVHCPDVRQRVHARDAEQGRGEEGQGAYSGRCPSEPREACGPAGPRARLVSPGMDRVPPPLELEEGLQGSRSDRVRPALAVGEQTASAEGKAVDRGPVLGQADPRG